MPSYLHDLKHAGYSLLLRMALVSLALAMIWLDIAVFHTQILEISFTEITQELMLLACALLFWTVPADPGHAGFKTLAGGFFACLLIRELDGLFDPISHSAWCWPFMAIGLFCVSIAANPRNRQATLADLAAFTRTRAFGALVTGFGVLLFSRVFGMGSLWHLILGDGYARLAKTTVEEGVELLAYSMWLAATLEYCLRVRSTTEVRQAAASYSPHLR
ncbi:putative membrane protein [Pseudomonas sp. TE3610]